MIYVNGILLINKPKGCTSRDVVNDLVHLFHTKKIGHTGTLDPIATGVMVVCIGNHTKLVNLLTSTTKEYIAKIRLGIKTDTKDITGSIIQKEEASVTQDKVEEVLQSFIGESMQTVPIYSAVKVNGKKLYQYARNNEEVELPTRKIIIEEMELLSCKETEIVFRTVVSKGTYIRSLIEDICNKLGTIGTMEELKRTKQGNFLLEQCYTLEDVKKGNYQLLSKESVLSNMESMEVGEELYFKIKNGAVIPKSFKEELCAIKYKGEILAIYQTYHKDSLQAKPYKML